MQASELIGCTRPQAMFWHTLSPNPANHSGGYGGVYDESSTLGQQITENFGSIERLKGIMEAMGAAVPGSGWVWLIWDRQNQAVRPLHCVCGIQPDQLTDWYPYSST